jgi:hypothetical protein
MARPKKIGLDYFPLDVVFNEQIQAVESVHGNDGLVWLIKFWQSAYKKEFGEVDLNGLFGDISAKNSRITTEKQKQIISDCKQLALLIEISAGVFTSNGIKKRMAAVSRERESALNRHKNELFGEKPPNNPQTMGESKVKESKVKERKEKNTEHRVCSLLLQDSSEKRGRKSVKNFVPPTWEEFRTYCAAEGYESIAERAYKGYSVASWNDTHGHAIKNWKQKLQNGWFRNENKDSPQQENIFTRPATKIDYERLYRD